MAPSVLTLPFARILADRWHQFWRGFHSARCGHHAAHYHRHHPEQAKSKGS